jgi:hypothetical protein
MEFMDHTPIEELLNELESVDPADAADIAHEVASSLSDELETDAGGDSETPA